MPMLPMNAADLMPHQPPMLLVERLLEKSDKKAKAEAVAPDGGMMIDAAGRIIPEYFIELMAQAMAAAQGYECLEEKKENLGGFMASIDAFIWYGGARPGERLLVDLEKILEFDAITCFEGRITQDGRLIAEGGIKVWEAAKA